MSVQISDASLAVPAKSQDGPKDALSRASLPLRIFREVLRAVFRLLFRVKVSGLEKVPHSPVIVCANHLGWTDAFLVLLFLPVEPRIYVLGEKEVRRISWFRRLTIDALRIMVPLDRDKPLQALRTMGGVLQKGGSLLMFTEGRIGEEEGGLCELQEGAAHLSQKSGVPLLPVGLTGTSKLWLRRRLAVRIGDTIAPQEFAGDLRTRLRLMTAELDTSMRSLLPGDSEHPRLRLLERWLTKLL
ncbi:MAG: 1-acyl-sn-glycerol-3-phosphate acyltransferase [Chloroflexota bacterium]|nr:1-acyl-sn-glycerol-3-phosphate acyltransferase [Chloroflexota bacterium]MDQ5865242.1 1-acyl-sn-glycerol-3-phosphate acyltransferase [Chloroflexota bacterium]